MTLIHGFIQTERFYDDVHFPHGFSKSGDFTIADAELLSCIGQRLLMLEQGTAIPENKVEEQFIFLCARTKGVWKRSEATRCGKGSAKTRRTCEIVRKREEFWELWQPWKF